jgi:hypothetical protein
MLHERMIDVARRKERLVARCEGQRVLVAQACVRWREPARIVDRAWSVVRFLRLHPAALVAGAAIAMVLGRRHLLKWAGRGIFAWRTWRAVSGWLRRFNA